jgi:inhibitor of cysteine peptidase
MKLQTLFLCFLLSPLSSAFAADPKPIAVEPGQKFSIDLEANHTTGYSWQLVKPLDEKQVKLLTVEYKQSKPGLIGAGGHEVWSFNAVMEGRTEIQMKYVRPWETNVPPARSTNVLVIVKKAGA